MLNSINSQASSHDDLSTFSVEYKLYKRRWLGIIGLCVLNGVSGMIWVWFGPIANNTAIDFSISLNQVNWLGNVITCAAMPLSLLTPILCNRLGINRTCLFASLGLLIGAWIRYAATVPSLSTKAAYALLMLAQIIGGCGQPIIMVLGPRFSETWFDLGGRTTATMLITISGSIGPGIGQIISPAASSTRQSIFWLAILCTAVFPFTFLIGSVPPTPPTYSGSKASPSFMSLMRALRGKEQGTDQHMSIRERFDYVLLVLVFAMMGSATNTFGVLENQILTPYGYSSQMSGLMGATILLTGVVGAVIFAPLLDRVFTRRLALVTKASVPVLAVTWFSMIWAVKRDNTGGLFAIMAILGMISMTLLPVALELGCEVTRNADGSSAILWFISNIFSIVTVLGESALRAGPEANPPYNMHRALIFNGAMAMVAGGLALLIKGQQVRRQRDEEMKQAQIHQETKQAPV